MIREVNATILSKQDGLTLHTLTVLPDGEAKALVQFVHGMAEHKERYIPIMRFLAEHGYACIADDHRGHGASVRSREDLGYFYKNGDRAVVEDVHQITLQFRAEHPEKKLVLFGHSMGSLIVRAYAAHYADDIDALIVCGSPGYNPAAQAGILLTYVMAALHLSSHKKSALLDALVNGTMEKRYPEDKIAWLSANEENRKAFRADPLSGFSFTINGYRCLLKLMRSAYDEKLRLPEDLKVHFISGADDPCAPDQKGFDAAVDNFRKRGCKQLTSHMYDGLRHEILNEGVQAVWDDLLHTIEGFVG